MISQIKQTVQKDIKALKRKYMILKIKWFFLFILPILIIVLAYQVSKQYLRIRIKELNA